MIRSTLRAAIIAAMPRRFRRFLKPAHERMAQRKSRRKAYARIRRESRNPQTYIEKIRYKMAFDRDPLLTTLCDKVAARDYVASIIGPEFVSLALALVDSPDSIDWESLPREFVCKVNHGSGGVLIVWEGADPDALLPGPADSVGWVRLAVHPDNADPAQIRAILNHWLTLDYSWFPGKVAPEWAYKKVKRRILVEELLLTREGTIPFDYRFHVVEGVTRLIRVTTPMGRGAYSAVSYDRDWNEVPVQLVIGGNAIPFADPSPRLPPNSRQLVELAERLARDVDSVRVDLYDLHDRIVFAELTNYPYAGDGYYLPAEFDREMGSTWTLRYGPLGRRPFAYRHGATNEHGRSIPPEK